MRVGRGGSWVDGCMDWWAAAQERERGSKREKCYVIKITKQFLAEGLFSAWATLAVMTPPTHTHIQRMPEMSATRTLEAFVYMEVSMCGILSRHISQSARERALIGGGRDYVNVARGKGREQRKHLYGPSYCIQWPRPRSLPVQGTWQTPWPDHPLTLRLLQPVKCFYKTPFCPENTSEWVTLEKAVPPTTS